MEVSHFAMPHSGQNVILPSHPAELTLPEAKQFSGINICVCVHTRTHTRTHMYPCWLTEVRESEAGFQYQCTMWNNSTHGPITTGVVIGQELKTRKVSWK